MVDLLFCFLGDFNFGVIFKFCVLSLSEIQLIKIFPTLACQCAFFWDLFALLFRTLILQSPVRCLIPVPLYFRMESSCLTPKIAVVFLWQFQGFKSGLRSNAPSFLCKVNDRGFFHSLNMDIQFCWRQLLNRLCFLQCSFCYFTQRLGDNSFVCLLPNPRILLKPSVSFYANTRISLSPELIVAQLEVRYRVTPGPIWMMAVVLFCFVVPYTYLN